MKVVFAGPSLHGRIRDGRIAGAPSLACRGPARQGDIGRAVADGATAIGLIDGRFEDVAAPWHKEIVSALRAGIAVCGAASMGALRAAECAPFGMVGIGEVYRRYASGDLVDDDAVAQLHAPADLDHAPLTEALVNIEATVAALAAAGRIGSEEAVRLGAAARRLHFKARTFAALAAACAPPAPSSEGELAALLIAHRVDLKAADAMELVRYLDRADGERTHSER